MGALLTAWPGLPPSLTVSRRRVLRWSRRRVHLASSTRLPPVGNNRVYAELAFLLSLCRFVGYDAFHVAPWVLIVIRRPWYRLLVLSVAGRLQFGMGDGKVALPARLCVDVRERCHQTCHRLVHRVCHGVCATGFGNRSFTDGIPGLSVGLSPGLSRGCCCDCRVCRGGRGRDCSASCQLRLLFPWAAAQHRWALTSTMLRWGCCWPIMFQSIGNRAVCLGTLLPGVIFSRCRCCYSSSFANAGFKSAIKCTQGRVCVRDSCLDPYIICLTEGIVAIETRRLLRRWHLGDQIKGASCSDA